LSKKYAKNLQVRNESFIHKKFISGKVPCEVSVVVKYTANVSVVLKQCVAQTVCCSKSNSTLHLENNQNTKKCYLLQVQNVEAVEVCCGV